MDKSVQDEHAVVAGGVRVWSFDQHGACDVRVDEDLPNDPHAARDQHRLRQRLSVVFVHHASLLHQAYAAAQRGRVAPGGGGGE